MAARLSVLFDLNIILDVLQWREPFYDASARALVCAETGSVEGWVAAHSLPTLCCLRGKYGSAEQARVAVSEMLSFLSVPTVGQEVIEQAPYLPYQDFEDAVQMIAAVCTGAD
jgi:hypothetical protein